MGVDPNRVPFPGCDDSMSLHLFMYPIAICFQQQSTDNRWASVLTVDHDAASLAVKISAANRGCSGVGIRLQASDPHVYPEPNPNLKVMN